LPDSLQDWREDELGMEPKAGTVGRSQQHSDALHRELQRETQRREHVLNMRHALAQEVTAKSKEVAGKSEHAKEVE